MINIFGEGPYLSLGELFGGSARELGKYYLHFFLFLAAVLLLKTLILKCTKRLKHTEKSKHNEKSKRIELAAAVLLPVLQIMYVWSVSIKSEFLYSFFLAFLITAQVRILNLIPLKLWIMLFCLLLCSFQTGFLTQPPPYWVTCGFSGFCFALSIPLPG